MKLSEAIALGRMLIVARKGREWFSDGSGCARGMALEGCGMGRIASNGISANWNRFFGTWGWTAYHLGRSFYPCGCSAVGADTPFATISHIFDVHISDAKHWTLDQLIDWIASVEPAEPAEVPAAEPAVAEAVAVRT